MINPKATPETLADELALWALASALHSNVPEDQRPMSWSDFSPEQIDRLRKAANAFLAALSAPAERLAREAVTDDDYVYRFQYADKSAFQIYDDGRAFIIFPDGRREEKFGIIDNRIRLFMGRVAKPRQDRIDALEATVAAFSAAPALTAGTEREEAIAKALQEFWQGPSGRSWQECCEKLPPQADWFRKLAQIALSTAPAASGEPK